MDTDSARNPFYVAVSSAVLTLVIVFAASVRSGRAPQWGWAALVATAISTLGIVFAKYGANFGLPWQVYYTVPMLATVLVPPIMFASAFGARRFILRWLP